jgi:hypothetical protein
LISDITLVGTYEALIQFYIPGDTNSVCSLSLTPLTVTIHVLLCTPSGSIPPVLLPPETVNIGSTNTYPMSSYFTNGDCFYSTSQDPTSPWTVGSSYTQEVLSLSGLTVNWVSTSPSLYVIMTDNNFAGTYTYQFTYTDYLGIVYTVPK